MPPLPGEERVLTVYADIHYYFTAPTPKPLHHRFDKGSYFYIYYNSTRRTSRLEVANNPGTPEIDVFQGFLDQVQLRWSYKFPTLLTLVVDAIEATSPGGQSPTARDPNEWRLAGADPRDERKYMYKLHTLDIYFWTSEDARLVVDTTKRLLSPNQLEYNEQQTAPSHDDSMSPVVQNLENIAISDPAYHNGQTRNSQNLPSAQQMPPQQVPQTAATPSSMGTQGRASAVHASPLSSKATDSPVNYTPMAYNPAAPPAPEPIAHREKTPPPPDAVDGTGLATAAAMDHHGALSPPITSPPIQSPPLQQHYTGMPPAQAPIAQASTPWGAPPTQTPSGAVSNTSLQHYSSVASASPHRSSGTPSFAPPPVDPNQQPYGAVSTTAQPVLSPGSEIYGTSYNNNHPPLQHLQPQYADYLSSRPQPPPGGYAQYSYDQSHQQPAQNSQYDVHNQVYRPTEAEVHSHVKPLSGGQKPGKLEERADRVEKRVNSFLKKLEKRL